MEIAITKMSSKGQIVIPQEMRSNFKPGTKIFIIKNKNQIILKNKDDLKKNFKEDLEFAKRTEEALKRIESGDFVSVDSKNLVEEMSKW